MNHNKNKQSLYLPGEMLAEIRAEAERLDRSISWLVQRAWSIAKDEIAAFPSLPHDSGSGRSGGCMQG